MKQTLILSALLILVLVAGTLGLAGEVASQTEVTPTASSTPVPTPAGERLEWRSLNGPSERVTYALLVVPGARSSTLYAGTWGHGVYRSRDGGDTWRPRSAGGGRLIKALAALPSLDETLYAGTFEEGLFRSTDGGKHWEPLGSRSLFTQPSTEFEARDPLFVESILVLSDGGAERLFVGTHYGIWASGDLGDNWEPLRSGFDDTDEAYNVQALAHDPSGRLYAGTLSGLYSSQDGGQTWQFIDPPAGYPGDARRILSLTVVTDTANYTGTLLIGTQGAGLYALGSDVESAEWFTRTAGFPEDRRARTIQVLLSAPHGMAYAGTVDHGVFATTDGGQTWEQIVEGLPQHSRSILSLARDPIDGALYAGTYGDGVYRLRADSQQWEPANTGIPTDFPVQKIAFAGPDGEHTLAGLHVGGMYLNTNRQEPVPAWVRLPKVLPIGPARNVTGLAVGGPDRSTVVIAAGTGIFSSTTTGETGHHLGEANGLPTGDFPAKALARGSQDPDVLYAVLGGGEGIYRSDDAGVTWYPARGDLEPELMSQVSCLAVGAEDETVYLGLLLGQVYVTHDGGTTWQLLSRIGATDVLELDWGQRTAWDVLLHGGPQRMLYARTIDGVYVSYDEGKSWRLRMGGVFSALLADSHRPWMVYAASPDTTVDREFAPQIKLPPNLWISHDGGKTWTWAGPGPSLPDEESPASITTLALDPNDQDLLYAGTEGAGIFGASLAPVIPPYRTFTPGAIALLLSLILLLGMVAYVVQTGLSLGRPYGLPLRTWPGLAYLRARYVKQVRLVGGQHTPLTALERLVLALAPDEPFSLDAMWQKFEEEEVSTEWVQVEAALSTLARDHRLLEHDEGAYRLTVPLLKRMARARFWDDLEERGRSTEEIRGQSRLRADIRQFFRWAEFDVSSSDIGFVATSSRPEYVLLDAKGGIYVHPHTAADVDAGSIDEARDGAGRAYGGQSAGKFTFLVVNEPPHVGAYRRIIHLRGEEDLCVVPLSHSGMRRAADARTACRHLSRSLQRALGNKDLFQLDGAELDLLDFFGRQEDLEKLVGGCRDGQVIGLGGMARVGKTSLARRLVDRLPQAVVAWVDLADPSELYASVRQAWLADAGRKFPQCEQPRLEPLSEHEQPSLAQIQTDVTIIRESLQRQASAVFLAVILDGLTDLQIESEEVNALAQALAETEGASLLGIFDAWPQHTTLFQMLPLRPFEEQETAVMLESLAVQMELSFDPAAMKQLHLASGGHPLLLRQLASLSIAQRGGSDVTIGTTAVEKAISQYVAQPDSALSHLWDSLTEEAQQLLRSVTGAKPPPSGDLLTQMADLGWLRQEGSRWQLFSRALDRWLGAHLASHQQ